MITRQTRLAALEEARGLAHRLLELSEADQTEVVLIGTDSRLTRFAQNQIHQNVSELDLEIRVRAVLGQRVGVATTNDPSDASLERVALRACDIARVQPENPDFKGLPGAVAAPACPPAFIERTASFAPAQRAEVVAGICAAAADHGLVASGAFQTGAVSLCVANSRGVFAHHVGTRAELASVVMGEDASGYAARLSMDAGEIDGEAVGREAIDKALRGRGPIEIEPGPLTVVLEEYAVADLLAYMAYIGFGALSCQQGASFMAGRLGQPVAGPAIDIWDDGLDPSGVVSPFDFEGVPRQRVELIARGVARGVVHDSFTAGREGRDSTGHALPAPNSWGPFPCNLFMTGGDGTPETLLAGVERGLWITRFHYVNVMDPKAAIITGMTRDGTFLIDRGAIARPVKNLRFTEEILGALSRVTAMTRDTRLLAAWFGSVRCPAIRIEGFTFSGRSDV